SGTLTITRYPLFTPINARPIPVFPAVASIIVLPGRSFPSRSAREIMPIAARSFTLPPGFRYASFAKTSELLDGTRRRRCNIGVSPTSSVMLSATRRRTASVVLIWLHLSLTGERRTRGARRHTYGHRGISIGTSCIAFVTEPCPERGGRAGALGGAGSKRGFADRRNSRWECDPGGVHRRERGRRPLLGEILPDLGDGLDGNRSSTDCGCRELRRGRSDRLRRDLWGRRQRRRCAEPIAQAHVSRASRARRREFRWSRPSARCRPALGARPVRACQCWHCLRRRLRPEEPSSRDVPSLPDSRRKLLRRHREQFHLGNRPVADLPASLRCHL